MTPAKAKVLGRRWAATDNRWRPGMRSLNGYRFISVIAPDIFIVSMEGSGEITKFVAMRRITSGPEGVYKAGPNDRLPEWPDAPDLRDPATRGAALEVVRERWGAPELQISPRLRFDRSVMDKGVLVGWAYYVNDLDEHFGNAASEAEALVAALEAAPPPP